MIQLKAKGCTSFLHQKAQTAYWYHSASVIGIVGLHTSLLRQSKDRALKESGGRTTATVQMANIRTSHCAQIEVTARSE